MRLYEYECGLTNEVTNCFINVLTEKINFERSNINTGVNKLLEQDIKILNKQAKVIQKMREEANRRINYNKSMTNLLGALNRI